jgi:protocadherin Fat 1/2/3
MIFMFFFLIFTDNQVFQFFVRAQDHGAPPLHADMPVEVYIMGPDDVAPMFERRDDKFFISEYSQPGNNS